jgi:hypothetical protein
VADVPSGLSLTSWEKIKKKLYSLYNEKQTLGLTSHTNANWLVRSPFWSGTIVFLSSPHNMRFSQPECSEIMKQDESRRNVCFPVAVSSRYSFRNELLVFYSIIDLTCVLHKPSLSLILTRMCILEGNAVRDFYFLVTFSSVRECNFHYFSIAPMGNSDYKTKFRFKNSL